ncbi:MAG TPA: hypothetical protein VK595_04335 [Vicinamibacterales bacterium]|nr:hypothetical protein [Vicinamibacterales bacterium]
MKTLLFVLAATALASPVWAEPMFLAKQYPRCTACHYSPTGGGLLTPYGRLLSHRELSTTGGTATAPAAGAADDPRGEQAFLYGALGNALGPVHLGIEARPSRLRMGFPGGHQSMNLLMNLDLIGAVQKNGWTAYGTVGREPPDSAVRDGRTLPDAAFISYEHWIAYQTDKGFQIRAGRFLPAYGVRFADHTTYSRIDLDLDRNDQVYGLELSSTVGRSLVQAMVSPGKAEAILHDSGHRGFSTAGRWQFDVTPRTAIVGSAFYRDSTDLDPKSGSVGGAFGFAPTSRVSIWTQVDANLQTKAQGGHSWVVTNETAVEAYRGLWLKFAPQLRTSGGAPGFSELRRLAFEADLLPRTHWNVNLNYYRDHDHTLDVTTSTLLAQLHLYL